MKPSATAPSIEAGVREQAQDRRLAGGPVVFYRCPEAQAAPGHEIASKVAVARAVAVLAGRDYAGDFDDTKFYGNAPYFVPSDTLIRSSHTRRLGIDSEHQLFGGMVPFPFVATKVISHGLLTPDSVAPHGWAPDLAERLADVVLPGLSAFSRSDAVRAGELLLQSGPVRIKHPGGAGGRGQLVVRNRRELESGIDALDPGDIARSGLVFECNLDDVETCSIGQARICGLVLSYCGTQRLTRANDGRQVYGGSRLLVARGDWDRLLALQPPPRIRLAVAQARAFHDAALATFTGMFASRSNYDVAQGVDAAGRWRSGVLEQSWRIGGATGAELAALRAFKDNEELPFVRASTVEVYGESPPVPADAVISFRGIDEVEGPLVKYSRIEPDGDSREPD